MQQAHLRIPPVWAAKADVYDTAAQEKRDQQQKVKDDAHHRKLLKKREHCAYLAAMSVLKPYADKHLEDWLHTSTTAVLEHARKLSNGHWLEANRNLDPHRDNWWDSPAAPSEGRWLPAAFIIAEMRLLDRYPDAIAHVKWESNAYAMSACMPDGETLEYLYREVIHQEHGIRDWHAHTFGGPWSGTDAELADLILKTDKWDASWVHDATNGKKNVGTQRTQAITRRPAYRE